MRFSVLLILSAIGEICGEAATVQFAQPRYNISETGVSVTVTLNLTGILDRNTTVSVSSYDVTAVAGQDYTAISNQQILFTPNGPTEQNIVIPISDDASLEGTESFVLTVSSQNPNARIGNNANTTVRIIDNDVVSVDFVQPTDSVLEQGGLIPVEIGIQGVQVLPVTVRIQSVNLNALAGSDYTAVDTTVTYQTTENLKTVNVFITNDNLIENDEQFVLRLTTTDGQVIINDDEMRITIEDNDLAAIRFESSTYPVDESNGSVTIGILLTGNLAIIVSAAVQINAQTAAAGADFTVPTTTTVVFPPNSNRAEITIDIVDDDIVETTESFLLGLSAIGSKVILGSPNSATVSINDDDNALVRFAISSRNVNEDAGILNMTIELVTTNPLQRDVSVSFLTDKGSAESPEDFSNTALNVTFKAGDSNGAKQYVIVPIIDDEIVEAPESFVIKLTSIDSGLTPTTFSSATINIIDNDSATLAFTQSTHSASEPDVTVQLFVLLTGTITRTVTARISTANLDATGGADYVSLVNQQITFSPDDPALKAVFVIINDDNIVENNERFTAILTAENGVNIRPDGSTTTVTIVDNDVAAGIFGFAQRDLNVPENGGTVQIAVEATANLSTPVTLSVAVAGFSASSNDYTVPNDITFTFSPTGPSRQFFTFTPVNDVRVENDEIVLATLSSTDPQAVIGGSQIQITIQDDDEAVARLDQSSIQTTEKDGFVNIGVSLTGTLDVPVTVNLAANELSAKEGDDFVFNDQTVVFQPGDTQATRQFVIIDDAVEENVEFATVALTSTDGNVVIGTPGTTTINIEDNDVLDANPSSDSNTGVIIGVVVAALVIIIMVILMVAWFFYRRRPGRENRQEIGDIQNAAYEGDSQPPRLSQVLYSDGDYEEPSDYAQLDSFKRVPIDANYQSLIHQNTQGTPSDHYAGEERHTAVSSSEVSSDYAQLDSSKRVPIDANYHTV